MQNIKGRIQTTKQRVDNYSVLVSEIWFGGFGKCPVERNDMVNIDYETKGRFNNISKIEKIDIDDQTGEADTISNGKTHPHSDSLAKTASPISFHQTFYSNSPEQLDNKVNMFCKDHKVKAWQHNALAFEGKIVYICYVTYEG